MPITNISEITTPQDVKEVLAMHNDIALEKIYVGQVKSRNQNSFKSVTIDYRIDSGTQAVNKGSIEMETLDDVTFKFVGGVPSIIENILNPPTAPTPQRDLHYTETQVLNYLNSNYTLVDDSDVDISVRGNYDIVKTNIINAQNVIEPLEVWVTVENGNPVPRKAQR